MPGRNTVNEIIPGKLYQRGQILTWQRAKKYAMFQQYGIKTVVNFWPKMDSDLAESGVVYLHIPSVQSEQMLSSLVDLASQWVAQLCERDPVLVICEAGVTRSVYFCVLVTSEVLGISLQDAKEYVASRLGRVSLKPLMLRRIAMGRKKRGLDLDRGL